MMTTTVLVDGQVALAEAAARNGVRRFIPSDFAIDLFAAPEGALHDYLIDAHGALPKP